MTTAEKLNYIITVLTEITDNSKNIGQLDVYNPNEDESENYVAIYSSIDGKTRRANINELFEILTGGVPPHTHKYNEVEGIGDYKTIAIEDDNGLNWRVERSMEDETNDSFKEDDKIAGFEDVAKTIYWEGLVLDSDISIPVDLTNTSKFLMINKKYKV